MRSAINANTVFVTVAMARQASKMLILVVEGDDDHFLVKDHVNTGDVLLISGKGRPLVLGAAEAAERGSIRGVRFLIDVDYDPFAHPTTRYPSNVISSQHHDTVMDVILVSITLLDRVIDSHSRSARRSGAKFDTGALRQEAFELAAQLAPLRILNERKGYELNLRDFPFGSLPSINPTPEDLASAVVNRSNTTLTAAVLATEIATERGHLGADQNVLIGDHDLFRALARVMHHYGVTVRPDTLWTAFLPGIQCSHLAATRWHQSLSSWGDANSRATFLCPCAA